MNFAIRASLVSILLAGFGPGGVESGGIELNGRAPAAAAAVAVAPQVGPCGPDDPTGVTVIIDFQDLGATSLVRCATGLTEKATGLDALQAAGITVSGTVTGGPASVCRIADRPGLTETLTTSGSANYVETCVDTPPTAAYWSYWWAAPDGNWTYSTLGPMSHRVKLGGFEGWSFALNAPSSSNPPPRIAPKHSVIDQHSPATPEIAEDIAAGSPPITPITAVALTLIAVFFTASIFRSRARRHSP